MSTKNWLALVSLTLFAFLLGWLKLINVYLVAVLLLSTFVKGYLVIDYFMGLSQVSIKYRIIPTLWLCIIVILIGIAYYFPASIV